MARRLIQAGYATLTVTRDALSGAAALRRQPGVQGDDLAIIGYGEGASSVLATLAERCAADVAQPPVFRSAVAFGPDCARHYGDWVGHSLANLAAPGSTGAPHRGDVASAGLYRSATPLLIAGGQGDCRDLARDSFAHEFFVTYTAAESSAPILAFLAENAQYSRVAFPSSQAGTTLLGELTLPRANKSGAAIIISPGTAGIEGFSFWERPWARRLNELGYAPACRALAASAHDAGVPIELEVYPDAMHRFDAGVLETPAATVTASVRRITTFIEAHSTY